MVDLSGVEITQNQCFVTSVYEIQLATGEDLEALNTPLLSAVHEIRDTGEKGIDYPGAGWQTPHDLPQRPAFHTLFEAIGTVMNECATAEGIPDEVSPVITGAWSNIESPGDYVRVHMHPWSVFSGVYYLKCDEDAGDIFLVDPRPGASALYWPTQEVTERGAINFEPKPGMLLLFPSWLEHYTDPNRSAEERICISFNTHFGNSSGQAQQWNLT